MELGDIVEKKVSKEGPKEPGVGESNTKSKFKKSIWNHGKNININKNKDTNTNTNINKNKNKNTNTNTNINKNIISNELNNSLNDNLNSTHNESKFKKLVESEREEISKENDEKIKSMSTDEIIEEREELLNTLNPKLIEKLLKKPIFTPGGGEFDYEPPKDNTKSKMNNDTNIKKETNEKKTKTETEKTNSNDNNNDSVNNNDNNIDFDIETPSVHFPNIPNPSSDSSEEKFLETLHNKYFPDLPIEPEKLAWMKPVSAKEESYYSNKLESLLPSELRFDFQGNLITPTISEKLDTNLGLHHHSDAPGAAGYTVVELAHLSRSTVPSQRCIAIQTLGRVLYKAKQGNVFHEEISNGILELVEPLQILQTLVDASNEVKTKHLATRTYAIEALWLWKNAKSTQKKAL